MKREKTEEHDVHQPVHRFGSGPIGETAQKALGGQSQVFFRTSTGARYVDQLVNGVAHESKVGYTSLTQDTAKQIAKDMELAQSARPVRSNGFFDLALFC
jgi:hypothetical protein